MRGFAKASRQAQAPRLRERVAERRTEEETAAHAVQDHVGNAQLLGAMQGEDVLGASIVAHAALALESAGFQVSDPFVNLSNTVANDALATYGPGDLWGVAARGLASRDVAPGASRSPSSRALDRATNTPGSPLPAAVKADVEQRFGGVGFDGVRIHTDSAAATASAAINARAFTMGDHVWFGAGEFDPASSEGLELLAHELVHVLQNRAHAAPSGGGEMVDGVAVSSPNQSHELEAVAIGRQVARGQAPSLGRLGGGSSAGELDGPVGLDAGLEVGPDVGLDVASGFGGGAPADGPSGAAPVAADVVAQRKGKDDEKDDDRDNEKPRKKKLEDGTVVTIYPDGKGGFYITSPKGDRLECDQEGKPTEAALDKQSKKAALEGENKPKPPEPNKEDPGKPNPETAKDEKKDPTKGDGKGDVTKPVGGSPPGMSGGFGDKPQPMAEMLGGPLAKYAYEKAWHDKWKAGGSKFGTTMSTEDNAKLAGGALLSGLAEGFVNGAQDMLVDTLLNKATKNIPYASGFIAIAQIAYDPKKWYEDTLVKGIGEKFTGGFDKAFGKDSDWIDRFEGVVNILEGLNNIIGLASTICMIVAAAGFILSFICPALIPFVALAVKWGLLLGEINTVVGLGINLLRLIIVVARTVQIMKGDADPKTQAERAKKLKEMTATWMGETTKRAGNKLQEKMQKGNKTPESDSTGKPKPPAPDAPEVQTKKSAWQKTVDGVKTVANTVTGVGDLTSKAGGLKENYQNTKDFTNAVVGDQSGQKGIVNKAKGAWNNAQTQKSWEKANDVDGRMFSDNTKARFTQAKKGKWDQQNQMKENVKGNIAKSKAARDASNFDGKNGKKPAPTGGGTAPQKQKTLAEQYAEAKAQGPKALEAFKKSRKDNAVQTNEGKGKVGGGIAKDKVKAGLTDPEFLKPENKANRKAMRRNLEKSKTPADQQLAQQMKAAEDFQRTRKQSIDPDYWEDSNKASRRAQRKALERQADILAKSKSPGDQEMAQQIKTYAQAMDRAEKRLHAFTSGNKNASDDSAVVRVTGEQTFKQRGTISKTGRAGVTKLDDNNGDTTVQGQGKKLGFTSAYLEAEKQKKNNYLAAIYSGKQLTKSDIDGMTKMLTDAGNKDFGSNPKEIKRTLRKLMNTPQAYKTDANGWESVDEGKVRSNKKVYGKDSDKAIQTQQLKLKLDSVLGANWLKTPDGITQSQSKREQLESEYKGKLQNGKQTNRHKNKLEKEYEGKNKGDQIPEYYDHIENDKSKPLQAGGAKKLIELDLMPVVKRLDWDTPNTQASQKKTENTDSDGGPPAAKGALKSFADGAKDTAAGFKPGKLGESLSSNDQYLPARGYGHDGTGGYGGAGIQPSKDMADGVFTKLTSATGVDKTLEKWTGQKDVGVFSSGAVDEQGNAVVGQDGKAVRVNHTDRALSAISGGSIGKDAAGNDNFGKGADATVEAERKELLAKADEFEKNYISGSPELPAAPVAQEATVDTGAADWAALDKEKKLLEGRKVQNADLKKEAEVSKGKLDAEKAAVEVNKGQVTNQKTDLDTKGKNQDKADQKIGEQGAKGGELSGSTGGVIGTIANFVVKFQDMCGMIPSSLSSKGASASGNAGKIGEGVKGANDSGKTTKNQSQTDKAEVTEFRAATKEASGTTDAASQDITKIEQTVAKEITDTETGKNELVAADAEIANKLKDIESRKSQAKSSHDTAGASLQDWAGQNEQLRTGQLSMIEVRAAELEKKKQELEKKNKVGGEVQRSAIGPVPTDAPESLPSSALSGGQTLPTGVRSRMESTFGKDFGGVRVHNDGAAHQAAAGFNAHAFTLGSHIMFGRGEFSPGTAQGDSLLAHELTHVTQQAGGPSTVAAKTLTVGSESSRHEQEAERNAKKLLDQRKDKNKPADGQSEGGDGELTPEQQAALQRAEGQLSGLKPPAVQPPDTPQTNKLDPNNASQVDEDAARVVPATAPLAGGQQLPTITNAGGGGASISGATTSGPAAAQGGGGKRELDGLVDHYMSTHWDSADFDSKVQEFGVYPDAIATELDRWLPAQTPPAVRTGANLLVGLGAGLLDAFFLEFAKSIPGVGIIFHVLGGLKDAWKDCSGYLENGDPVGAVLIGLRHAASAIGGAAGNFGDLCTAVQDGAHVLAPFTLGVSEAVGVPAAALATGSQAVSAFCAGFLAGIDAGMIVYDVIQANRMEEAGQFQKAGFFREQARGQVFRTVTSVLKAIVSATSTATAAVVPGGAPQNFTQLLSTSAQKFQETLGALKGDKVIDTIANANDRFSGSADAIGAASQGYNNLMAAIGLGDNMKRSSDGFAGGHFIGREQLASSGTEAGQLLAGARQQTIDQMNTGWAGLEGNKPLWHQDVINKIVSPESGSWVLAALNLATSPSEWIRLQFAGMRHVMTFLGDSGLQAISGMAGLAGSALSGIAQPFVDNVNEWIAEQKPAMDEWLGELNTKIQAQQISMQKMRDTVTAIQNFSTQTTTWLDESGSLNAKLDEIIGSVAGFKLDGGSLGIPDWVPERLYSWALNAINTAVSSAAGFVREIKDSLRAGIDAKIGEVDGWIQEKLAKVQEAIAEGGEVETMMNDQLAQLKSMMQTATEAFAAWDGRVPIDFSGAAGWLQEMSQKAADGTSEAKQKKFTEYVSTVAQAYVDQWKGAHGEDVSANYYPEVPAHELAAVDQAYALLSGNYTSAANDVTNPYHLAAAARLAQLQAAYDACKSFAGRKGAGALKGFWAAEERLARLGALPLEEADTSSEEYDGGGRSEAVAQ